MARLSARQLKSIVARDLPGYQLVARGNTVAAVDRRVVVDEVAPEIRTAAKTKSKANSKPAKKRRSKRGSEGEEGSLLPVSDNPGHGEKLEDELVTVERTDVSDPFNPSRRKAVIISGEDGRVIGSQG
jgi:hypothetical protein